jgi:hypothetical protein
MPAVASPPWPVIAARAVTRVEGRQASAGIGDSSGGCCDCRESLDASANVLQVAPLAATMRPFGSERMPSRSITTTLSRVAGRAADDDRRVWGGGLFSWRSSSLGSHAVRSDSRLRWFDQRVDPGRPVQSDRRLGADLSGQMTLHWSDVVHIGADEGIGVCLLEAMCRPAGMSGQGERGGNRSSGRPTPWRTAAV